MCSLHSCIDELTAEDIQKAWREEAYAAPLQSDEEGIILEFHIENYATIWSKLNTGS